MKNILYGTNSLFGLVVSIYGNLDFGRPLRLRSKGFIEFFERFYHLTHIGLLLTSISFLMGMLYRRQKRYDENSRISKTLKVLYMDILAITVTAECFIPLIFWVLWHIDESSVVTKSSYVGEDTISLFFNLCMHGLPTIFLLVEFFTFEFLGRRGHYLFLFLFFMLYIGVMYLFNIKTGEWPYGIVGTLAGPYRITFFAACFAVLCALYYLLSCFHFMVWKTKHEKRRNKERKLEKTV
ncbi:hypothetical protein NEMIN01_1711 [Nematocida minor]|uniref:uncharacterized protein n=1 Tax=Nematocida minor TaxID=1912983 RepID=UPI00221FCE26|nr:uncharacterized protein NEMIN01_1711 [Nematocida minor]KAI5191856.1 hypothetical protein NEMIN01_1711 [Nematocida minor]